MITKQPTETKRGEIEMEINGERVTLVMRPTGIAVRRSRHSNLFIRWVDMIEKAEGQETLWPI